jgi:hypothetical protein
MTEHDPITTLIIDADHVAHLIENLYGEYFSQPAPAIYVQGEEVPRITLDRLNQYRQLSGMPVTKLDDITSPVCDRHDVTIISAMDISRGFSLAPTTPWIGRKLVEDSARDAVDDAVQYEMLVGGSCDATLLAWLRPECRNDIALFETIRDVLMINIYEPVAAFVRGPTWNIHHVRRIGGDVFIDKGDDFRIYEYHRLTKTPYMKGA